MRQVEPQEADEVREHNGRRSRDAVDAMHVHAAAAHARAVDELDGGSQMAPDIRGEAIAAVEEEVIPRRAAGRRRERVLADAEDVRHPVVHQKRRRRHTAQPELRQDRRGCSGTHRKETLLKTRQSENYKNVYILKKGEIGELRLASDMKPETENCVPGLLV